MLRLRCTWRARLVLCACLAAAGCSSVDSLNQFPLAEPETDRLPGSMTPLGPLVDWQWKESTVQWGVRPLFSVRNYYNIPLDRKAQFDVPFFAPPAVLATLARRIPAETKPGEGKSGLQVYVIYPIFRHESSEPQSRTMLLPLYYNVRDTTEDGSRWHNWALFPLYFGGRSDERGSYHAVVPLGGMFKNVFGRDKIRFVLFPIYSHVTTGERESYNVLWPFINYASGGGRDRWYVWPVIGRMKRQNNPARWYFLWPFFWYTEKPGEGERDTRGSVLFPLWGWQKQGDVTTYNVVWPLYSHARNEKTGRSDTVAPWPILRIGNGEDYYRRQVWPFFGYLDDAHVHRHYVLWPFYQRELRETDRSRMSGRSFLIIYRSIHNTWEDASGGDRSDYENLLWPIWYHKRDGLGNTYFKLFNLRYTPDPQGWDRFITFIWRIFEHEKRVGAPDSVENPWRSTRALWSAFRYDRTGDASSLRVFPLFSSKRASGRFTAFETLMGMFGFVDKPGKRTYKILFIPWTVDRGGDE